MVQLEEVPDDELHAEQPGPNEKEDDDEWDTDTGRPAQVHEQWKSLLTSGRLRDLSGR